MSKSVRWLQNENVPIGYVIVDDGWQTVSQQSDNHDAGAPILSEFAATGKFDQSLKFTADEVNATVVEWTSVLGYWGGVSLNDKCECEIRTVSVKG